MNLDVGELASSMIKAFKGELSEKWPDVKEYAETEARKLAENFAMIERMKLSGEITEQQAKLHHDIQKNASRAVLLAVEGLGLIAVEQALNAAMNVLRETVNGALDFALL